MKKSLFIFILSLALFTTSAHGEQVVSNMSRPIYTLYYDKDFNFWETRDVSRFVQTNDIIHDIPLYPNGRTAWTLCYKFVLSKSMTITSQHSPRELCFDMKLLDVNGNILYADSMTNPSGPMGTITMRFGTGPVSRPYIQYAVPAGTYYVMIRGAGSPMSHQDFTVTIDGTIYENDNDNGNEDKPSNDFNYPDVPDESSSDPAGVGGIPMSLNVSAMGGATLSVPIDVPQGVGGMQPKLGIAYNSQGGNGVAGFGCDISGLSAITRAPGDIYHDVMAGALTYGTGDAYYLDGQRLMLVSGTEGINGSVYNPESDPFTKITLHGTGAATWLEVHAPNGMTYYYGSGTGRQVLTINGAQRAVSWRLDHAVDPLGNYMDYTYTPVNNTLYLSSVAYGGNTGVATGLTNTVTFDYETRQDVMPFILGNAKGQLSQRLRSITTKTNNNVYRTYTLNYNTTGDGIPTPFSRLSSVSVANAKGEQLKPVSLNWAYIPHVWETPRGTDGLNFVTSYMGYDDDQPYMVSGDANGDGVSDILVISPVKSGMNIGFATSTSKETFADLYLSYVDGTGATRFTHKSRKEIFSSSPLIVNSATSSGSPMCVDYDGDGTNEFIIFDVLVDGDDIGGAWMKFLGGSMEGQSFAGFPLKSNSTEFPCTTASDLDNDGKVEVILLEKGKVDGKYHISVAKHGAFPAFIYSDAISLPSKPMELFASDLNSDGLQDLMVLYDKGYTIFWNQGHGTTVIPTPVFSGVNVTTGTGVGHAWRVSPGDFNGDGLMDFVTANSKDDPNYYLSLNDGNGAFTKSLACALPIHDQDFTTKDNARLSLNVLDFDGDGKSDVVVTKAMYARHSDTFGLNEWGEFDKTYTYWLRSTGSSLTTIRTASSNSEEDGRQGYLTTGDFNGDGRAELMNYGYDCFNATDASVPPTWNIYSDVAFTDNTGKVTSITDSYGNTTSIAYSPLTQNGIYAKGAGAVYPMVDLAAPISVVKSVTAGNGATGDITTNYSYYDLKAHLQGKGVLGFSSMTTTNTTLGTTSETGVDSWDMAHYVPSRSYTAQTVGGQTATTGMSMSVADKGDHVYFAYSSSRVDTDLDGNQYTTTTTYDASHGYPLEERVTSAPGMYKARQYSNYVLAGGGYKPGLVTETSKHPDDGAEAIKRTAITYNTTTGLKQSQVEYSGDPLALTTYFQYDAVGNLMFRDVSGAGMATTKYSSYYDPTYRFVKETYDSPPGVRVRYTYDALGNVLTKTDQTNTADALTTTYEYDGWGNLTATTFPDGTREVTKTGWAADTKKRWFTLTEGTAQPWVKTWHDSKGREVSTETIGQNSLAISTATTYDAKGNISGKVNVQGNLTITDSYTYDARGRQTSYVSSTGKSVSYAYGNRSVTTTDAGRVSTKVLDAWGNTVSSVDPVSKVDFAYASNGKPRSVTSAKATITMGYDGLGNQVKLVDPDAGTYTYGHDAAGRVTTQTDGNGHETTNTYDGLNRLASSTIAGVTTTYTYGNSGNEVNQLVSQATGGNVATYAHDRYGRVISERRTIEGVAGALNFAYAYNGQGQLASTTYPGGVVVANAYDAYGNLAYVSANDQPVWQATESTGTKDAFLLGGKLVHANVYDSQKGTLSYFNYGRSWDDPILSGTYDFDGATGNLMSRWLLGGDTEWFTYDNMDRLTGVSGGSTGAMAMTYAIDGNMAGKSDIGPYHYDLPQSHAVSKVDNSASLLPRGNQTITYNGFNKVGSINDTNWGTDLNTLLLTYGPDRQRWKTQLLVNGTLRRQTIFAGNYEAETEGGVTRQLYYIHGGEGLAAIYVRETNKADNTYYAITDHLGSVLQLVDTSGNAVYAATYDAWGRRYVTVGALPLRRGYGGHEHLDEFALINMNGRLYDQFTGRFLSPDPYVQIPESSQSVNRYSYCLNNPLKYTDPDGEFVWYIPIATALINWVTNGCKFNMEGLSYLGIGAVEGAATLSYPKATIPIIGAVESTNTAIHQGFASNWTQFNGQQILMNGIIAMGTASIGGEFGKAIHADRWFRYIKSPLLRDPLTNITTNSIVGGVIGGAYAELDDDPETNFWDGAWEGMKMGFVTGSISGIAHAAQYSLDHKVNLLTGKPLVPTTQNVNKPIQNHHFATDKNKKFTPKMKGITDKYDLDLNGDWNKQMLPHQGRHPNAYHSWVYDNMHTIDAMPNMNRQQFIHYFDLNVKQPVISNPDMLYKNYWK